MRRYRSNGHSVGCDCGDCERCEGEAWQRRRWLELGGPWVIVLVLALAMLAIGRWLH